MFAGSKCGDHAVEQGVEHGGCFIRGKILAGKRAIEDFPFIIGEIAVARYGLAAMRRSQSRQAFKVIRETQCSRVGGRHTGRDSRRS